LVLFEFVYVFAVDNFFLIYTIHLHAYKYIHLNDPEYEYILHAAIFKGMNITSFAIAQTERDIMTELKFVGKVSSMGRRKIVYIPEEYHKIAEKLQGRGKQVRVRIDDEISYE
jgi:hypothetical protein